MNVDYWNLIISQSQQCFVSATHNWKRPIRIVFAPSVEAVTGESARHRRYDNRQQYESVLERSWVFERNF